MKKSKLISKLENINWLIRLPNEPKADAVPTPKPETLIGKSSFK